MSVACLLLAAAFTSRWTSMATTTQMTLSQGKSCCCCFFTFCSNVTKLISVNITGVRKYMSNKQERRHFSGRQLPILLQKYGYSTVCVHYMQAIRSVSELQHSSDNLLHKWESRCQQAPRIVRLWMTFRRSCHTHMQVSGENGTASWHPLTDR